MEICSDFDIEYILTYSTQGRDEKELIRTEHPLILYDDILVIRGGIGRIN